MGVINVTPDSFADEGRHPDPECAVEYGLQLVEAGADILDVGGESSRPGASPVSAEIESERVLPTIAGLRKQTNIPISVDTYKASVARYALDAGADIVNDISSFRLDPDMPRIVAAAQAGIVLVHMRGSPETMQQIAPSQDILTEIEESFRFALTICQDHRISKNHIVLDPGIGFGKTVGDNLKIINRLDTLRSMGLPILVGTSRKSFIGAILENQVPRRLLGTAASVAVSILRGAQIVRVHDVAEMLDVVRVSDAIANETM
jgi:dihydropteroate synthase